MTKFLLGLIIGLALLPALGYMYILFGYAPVATAAPPFPFEKKLAGMALHARIKKEAPAQPALPPGEDNLLAGAKVYREYCAICHGMPGQPPTPAAKGMFPRPPQLLHGKGVTDDPVGQTYWIAANGIRLSGMPAYRGSLNDIQLWQVSQLLANADRLPASVTNFLSQPAQAQ